MGSFITFVFLIIFSFESSSFAQTSIRAARPRIQRPQWCEDLGIQSCMTAFGGANNALLNLDNINPEVFLPPAWAEHIRRSREDRRTRNTAALNARRTSFLETQHLNSFLKSIVIVPSARERAAHLSLTRPARLVIDCRGAHIQISESVFSTRCPVTIGTVLQNVAALSSQIQTAVERFHTQPHSVLEAQFCVDCISRRTTRPTLRLRRIRWEAAHGNTEVAVGVENYSPTLSYVTESCRRSTSRPTARVAEAPQEAGESAVEFPEIEGFNSAVNNLYGFSAGDDSYWPNILNQMNSNVAFGYDTFYSQYGNYNWEQNFSRRLTRSETRRMFRQWQRAQRRWERSREGREYRAAWRSYRAEARANRTQITFQDPTVAALQSQITAFVTRANTCMRDLCECSKTGELKNAISSGMEMHAPLAMSYAIEAWQQIRGEDDFETRCAPPEETETPSSTSEAADEGV